MTKQEFDDWKTDFRTREFLSYITAVRDAAREAATDPSVLNQPNSHLLHARYVGIVEGCDSMLKFEIEQDEVEENHDE